MSGVTEHLKTAIPPAGASLAGWPWWAVTALLIIAYGPSWAMAWLDLADRLRRD
jgi:hypothetical protein